MEKLHLLGSHIRVHCGFKNCFMMVILHTVTFFLLVYCGYVNSERRVIMMRFLILPLVTTLATHAQADDHGGKLTVRAGFCYSDGAGESPRR